MARHLSSYGFRAALIGAMAFIGAGCSSEQTKTMETWRDPTYVAGPLKDIVVIGANLNDTDRRTLEDGFAAALSNHGIRATPSHTVLPAPMPNAASARAIFQQQGYDGVLVSALRGRNTTTRVAGDRFWASTYTGGWRAPEVVNDTVVKFETTLWDPAGDGNLVWSTVTESDGPSTGKAFTASLTKKLVPMMQKAGVIPPASGQAVSFFAPTSSMRCYPRIAIERRGSRSAPFMASAARTP